MRWPWAKHADELFATEEEMQRLAEWIKTSPIDHTKGRDPASMLMAHSAHRLLRESEKLTWVTVALLVVTILLLAATLLLFLKPC